jgi:hypothetical protein
MQEWVKAIDAHEKFYEYEGYGYSKYGSAASLFLEAYEKNDSNALEEAKKENCLKYIENCLTKIVRNLKLYTISGDKRLGQVKKEEKLNKLLGNDPDLDSSTDEEDNKKIDDNVDDKNNNTQNFNPENFE